MLYFFGKELVALFTLDKYRCSLELLCADLDHHLWMGNQVVIPVRVRRPATVAGEDKQAFAIEKGRQWVDALLPASGTCGGQQKQGRTLKRSSDLALMRAKFLDDLPIPVVQVKVVQVLFCHIMFLSCIERWRWRSCIALVRCDLSSSLLELRGDAEILADDVSLGSSMHSRLDRSVVLTSPYSARSFSLPEGKHDRATVHRWVSELTSFWYSHHLVAGSFHLNDVKVEYLRWQEKTSFLWTMWGA